AAPILQRFTTPSQVRIRHKQAPPAPILGAGPSYLFRFSLDQATFRALGRYPYFAFDSSSLVPRTDLSNAKKNGLFHGRT
ncbi:MAG: hypothetical protein WB586_14390, partial [Chthoniobacterales bacterium]